MKPSIVETHPEIAAQWHPIKNGDLRPKDFTYGSHQKVWWQCNIHSCHEWQSRINHRTCGTGCPFCTNQRVCHENCLATTHPELIKEWHPIKNGNITPKDVIAGSGKKIWWKCSAAEDHEWQTSINNRTRHGCWCCMGLKVVKSNCLVTTHPELANEWHPTKNGSKKPDNYTAGSGEKIWWQCSVFSDHEWQATICHRKHGNGCPCCRASKGELAIEKYLKNNGISFEREHKFKSCKRKIPLPFDFVIKCKNKNIKLIEYQGEQHYNPISFGSKHSKMKIFTSIKESDEIKNNWCKNNNIPLLEIPYWDFDRIQELLKNFLEINT